MMKILVKNKKAYFDFSIRDQLTAGMVLTGAEVKSLKLGQGSLSGAYILMRGQEPFLINCYVSPYKYASQKQLDLRRERKLLLNKNESKSLVGKEKGLVIIPLEIFEQRGLLKLKIGIARPKKKYDKRESIKKRDMARQGLI